MKKKVFIKKGLITKIFENNIELVGGSADAFAIYIFGIKVYSTWHIDNIKEK